jgi:hypothetical protein
MFLSSLSPPSSGLKNRATKKPRGAGGKLRFDSATYFCWFLPLLIFNPEDRGDILLRSVMLSLNYMAAQYRRLYSSKSPCENLEPNTRK